MAYFLNSMKYLLYFISIVLQLFYLVGLVIFFQGVIEIVHFLVELNQVDGPKPYAATMLSQKISVLMNEYLFPTLIALTGLPISWLILTKANHIPQWYVSINKYLSILWLFFIPLGTLVGYFQLRKIRRINSSL